MSEAAGEPITALVVDDDPAMRALLRDWLEREGFRVLLALAQGARFDVVILDKEMPGLGGFDVLPAFGRQRPEVPVILVTAFGGARVAEEALKLGAQQYLEKPFQFRALIAAVRAATAASARRGDAEETERRAQP